MTRIDLGDGLGYLRRFQTSDAAAIAGFANNRKIWLNLRDLFPHPYGVDDAEAYIAYSREREPPVNLAIVCGNGPVGSIGIRMQSDVERVSGELGYWIGEPFWGRGLATAAVRTMCPYAFQTLGLTRLFAMPFAANTASARVLEKAGFRLEARLRRAVIKQGDVVDQLLYAMIDDERVEPW